jgi:hypothetical protein
VTLLSRSREALASRIMHLTYSGGLNHKGELSADQSAGAGAPDEIEVTSAMVEAARGFVFSFDPSCEYEEDCLHTIYQAMERARRDEGRAH